MLPKPTPAKKNSGGGGDAGLLHDLETLSKALSLDTPAKKPAPARSVSAGRPNPNPNPKKESKKNSFWSWKPLRALSHIRSRRFDCRFSLHVHSVDNLPQFFSGSTLVVHWKRTTDPAGSSSSTRPARVFGSAAEFEEVLNSRCSVYGTTGSNGSAKYESRHFLIWVSVLDLPGIDLGRNLVDLTRLLPLTLEELEEEEKSSGKWSTSFRLSGKGKGASIGVSFGFSLAGEKMRRTRSVENIKALPELLPSLRSEAAAAAAAAKSELEGLAGSELLGLKSCEEEVEEVKGDGGKEYEDPQDFMVVEKGIEIATDEPKLEKVEFEIEEIEVHTDSEKIKVSTEKVDKEDVTAASLEKIEVQAEQVDKGDVIDEEEVETVEEDVDETSIDNHVSDSAFDSLSIVEWDNLNSPRIDLKTPRRMSYGEFKADYKASGSRSKSLSLDDETVTSEFLSMLGVDHNSFGMGSDSDPESPRERLWKQFEKESLNSGTGLFGLDMGSPKEQFGLDMGSPKEQFGLDMGSPKEQFGLDTGSLKERFGFDMGLPEEQFGFDTGSPEKHFGLDMGSPEERFGLDMGSAKEPDWAAADFAEDFDLSAIVHEAETEYQKATQATDIKSRARQMEDAETEALMRQWGLDEKAFQGSPPGNRSGFGSPIDLPPEETPELPPLCEGLGSFVETKDGGFLRSMSPSLFKNAKNNGHLIMQVSSPVVVPAEIGSGIMEILQRLASVGIEKLSMQAKKLMPLEDVSGTTMQQMAWEAAPALEACDRQGQYVNANIESGVGEVASGRSRRGRSSNLASSVIGKMASEYVSIEDLAPLAMDKIEALSIEGLRIQSGMSDEEAPSNISPQSMGEISALEGKGATNSMSLGLEGTGGLQLMDVKDNGDDIDGLMGLSITLDEWMRLDSGIVDEEDEISDRTSKVLAAHHACATDMITGGLKRGGRRSQKRWGLLGNNFTVALMVQLRDPLRNYEPVGTPMLSLIQVERVFVPPKPKIYSTVSEKRISEESDEPETKSELDSNEEKKEEDVIPQFKITEVHIAGLKTEPSKKKVWGNPVQQQSGSRWLLATGMGKSNKHPFMKSKTVSKPSPVPTTTVQPEDSLWSVSSRVHGNGAKRKELLAPNPHIRNPNVIFRKETIRLK